jgi:hypothetical protein
MGSPIEKSLNAIRGIPFYPGLSAKAKYMLLDVFLTFLGAAFEVVSRNVPEIKEEIGEWNEGRRFALGVMPKGPYVTVEKRGDELFYLGKGLNNPDVSFLFKNLDAAVPVFTGLMSSHQAVAECKVMIQGNNSFAMETNRALAVVLANLFPVSVFGHLFKDKPKMGMMQLANKTKVYLTILPAFLKHALLK